MGSTRSGGPPVGGAGNGRFLARCEEPRCWIPSLLVNTRARRGRDPPLPPLAGVFFRAGPSMGCTSPSCCARVAPHLLRHAPRRKCACIDLVRFVDRFVSPVWIGPIVPEAATTTPLSTRVVTITTTGEEGLSDSTRHVSKEEGDYLSNWPLHHGDVKHHRNRKGTLGRTGNVRSTGVRNGPSVPTTQDIDGRKEKKRAKPNVRIAEQRSNNGYNRSTCGRMMLLKNLVVCSAAETHSTLDKVIQFPITERNGTWVKQTMLVRSSNGAFQPLRLPTFSFPKNDKKDCNGATSEMAIRLS